MIHTNSNYNDGFGSQFQTIISCILFCDANNEEFVYTPLSHIEHNYDNDPEFIEKVETLMNIKNNFKNISDLDNDVIVNKLDSHKTKIAIDNSIDYFTDLDMMKKIKEHFWENKKDKTDVFGNGKINVTIHIRRPNKIDPAGASIGDSSCRYIDDDYYLNIINNIRKKYNNVLFHIYSQGEISDFTVFNCNDIVLHIDENMFDTFIALVSGEILVLSPSSFSYSAGLLSNGIVFYCPFWHSRLSKWLKID